MPMTRESPIKLPEDCSKEEFERACEFVKKVKEIDEERNHRGIFIQYVNAMKLYQSGSLNMVELKDRINTIFKNCEFLLFGFDQILKDCRRDDASNLKRMTDFVKKLTRVCEHLRGDFVEAFERHILHDDVHILKEDMDMVFRHYPCMREEFRMILVDRGLLHDDETRYEDTDEEEDELLNEDMYFH